MMIIRNRERERERERRGGRRVILLQEGGGEV
jgi:hypothetical protein